MYLLEETSRKFHVDQAQFVQYRKRFYELDSQLNHQLDEYIISIPQYVFLALKKDESVAEVFRPQVLRLPRYSG